MGSTHGRGDAITPGFCSFRGPPRHLARTAFMLGADHATVALYNASSRGHQGVTTPACSRRQMGQRCHLATVKPRQPSPPRARPRLAGPRLGTGSHWSDELSCWQAIKQSLSEKAVRQANKQACVASRQPRCCGSLCPLTPW